MKDSFLMLINNMIEKQRYLHLDFDECIISSQYATNEKHADEMLYIYGEYYEGIKYALDIDSWFVTFVRSWTRPLIKHYQEKLGIDNVGILTWGTQDYVECANRLLKLGIPNDRIYSRDHLYESVPFMKDFNMVLVDNEYYNTHVKGPINKVNFLGNPSMTKFIKVPRFDVTYFKEKNDIKYDTLISNIEKAFEYN